jgi:hypothetical protein
MELRIFFNEFGCSDFLVRQGIQWRKFGKSISVIPAYAGMTEGYVKSEEIFDPQKSLMNHKFVVTPW